MRAAVACAIALAAVAVAARNATAQNATAQNGSSGVQRTTRSGVYADAQAARGSEIYLMQCKSCHTPASHTGVVFVNSWHGKPLSALYTFIVERMPKNEPGSLQPYEYADVLAYLLKLNDMPSGSEELPADSVALRKIRIDAAKRDP
jgi:mono/diheme cytochrome c family protein